ncbi:hypothetical protein EW145_g1088 [Phellinidium pouzarii]|uniref:Nuclear cap-binding protein subunit 2 n=1 Tax=Phellinidium pouzarii TaxID=167371 RepID=A0A4V3XDR3_9AGAM|nr:hypothetical protein EW145_g1088 [Phellinidium pouzarii]
MAHVVTPLDQPSNYKDSQARVDRMKQDELLSKSSTLYVGNLSFYTTEEQIYELFSKCACPEEGGGVKRIIMGLDRNTRTPCGFCFVEYYTNVEALACMRYVRDEHRQDYDAGRGGWGAHAQRVEMERRRELDARYTDSQDGPGAVAGGGEDWKASAAPLQTQVSHKRERSPEDEDPARTGQRLRTDDNDVEAERM